jgi:hypothetical protein
MAQEDTQSDSCRWRSQRRGMELTQTRGLAAMINGWQVAARSSARC